MTIRLDAATPCPLHEGFFMPAEWDVHRRTWMCWPTRAACFGGHDNLLRAKQACARVARAISAFEPVVMVARSDDAGEAKLATGGKAEIIELPIDDSWARDIGPTFLKNSRGRLSGVQWQFNGWGERYPSHAEDSMLARRVLEILALPAFEAPIVCEGGAFHSDGQGTLLATEQCLLNVNRNPTADKEDIERCFALYIGARKVIWLGAGFADDETDGHVDNIACFAAPGKVVLGVPAMKSHPDFSAISEARRRLEQARDAEGRAFEIVELPQPKKIRVRDDGRLTPASYVNFYLVNGAVIMPAFDNANDEPARSVLTSCFPDRDIMQIEALDIIAGGGGIHCLTQQEPKS